MAVHSYLQDNKCQRGFDLSFLLTSKVYNIQCEKIKVIEHECI